MRWCCETRAYLNKTQKHILKETSVTLFLSYFEPNPKLLSFPQYELKINNSSHHRCHLDYNGNNEVCVILARVKIKPRLYDRTFSIPCPDRIRVSELTTDQGKVN